VVTIAASAVAQSSFFIESLLCDAPCS
jgi:hypothetical protein